MLYQFSRQFICKTYVFSFKRLLDKYDRPSGNINFGYTILVYSSVCKYEYTYSRIILVFITYYTRITRTNVIIRKFSQNFRTPANFCNLLLWRREEDGCDMRGGDMDREHCSEYHPANWGRVASAKERKSPSSSKSVSKYCAFLWVRMGRKLSKNEPPSPPRLSYSYSETTAYILVTFSFFFSLLSFPYERTP